MFAVGVELFNIIRVIFYSPSGLTTPNNWTYFAFYASLFLAAAVFLCADALGGRNLSLKVRYGILQFAGSFFVLWQALFAAFDLSTSLSVGKISGVATMVAFAALFLMEPLYAVVNITAGYLIMLAYLATLNDPGAVLNYVIMGMMTLVIYFARYHGICTELTQAGRIEDINRALEETEEQFRLSSEQYDLLLRQGNLIAFRWDIKEDVIRFSPAWKDVFDLPQQIDHIRDKVETGRRLNDQQKKTLLHCLTEAYATAAYQKQEVLLPVKGGKERWFEVHIAFQHGRDGQPVVGVGLLFDSLYQDPEQDRPGKLRHPPPGSAGAPAADGAADFGHGRFQDHQRHLRPPGGGPRAGPAGQPDERSGARPLPGGTSGRRRIRRHFRPALHPHHRRKLRRPADRSRAQDRVGGQAPARRLQHRHCGLPRRRRLRRPVCRCRQSPVRGQAAGQGPVLLRRRPAVTFLLKNNQKQ